MKVVRAYYRPKTDNIYMGGSGTLQMVIIMVIAMVGNQNRYSWEQKSTLHKQANIDAPRQASIKELFGFLKLSMRKRTIVLVLGNITQGISVDCLFLHLNVHAQCLCQKRSSSSSGPIKQGQGRNVLDLILTFGIFHKVTALRSRICIFLVEGSRF